MADWRDELYERLRYYFGPTGVPERLAAAGQMLNPVSVAQESMRQAGRAADPELSARERFEAGVGSLTEGASMLIPMAGMASRGPSRAIAESLTGFDVAPETVQALRLYDEAFPPADVQEELAREASEVEVPEDFWAGRDIVDEEGYAIVPNERPFEYSDEPAEPWAIDPYTDMTDEELFLQRPFEYPEPDEINFDGGFQDFLDGGGGGDILEPPPDEIDFDIYDIGDFDPPTDFPDQIGTLGGFRPLREDAYGFESPASPYLMEGQTSVTTVSPMELGDSPDFAGMYSRAEKAAQNLKQPTYSDLTQVRRELEARGAPPRELDTQMDYLESQFPAGEKISRDEIQGALGNYKGLIVNRTPVFAKDYAPSGGYNGTSTYFTHENVTDGPDVAYTHFDTYGAPPLAHTRAAQYDITTPDGTPAQTHHVIEIQSDWAQYRQGLPKSDEEVQQIAWNLVRAGRIEEAQKVAGRPEFDQTFPAPYVKNENDWLDLGVRQNLIDAVNSGSDWITFGNGAQANRHIGMPRTAADRFYNEQVPKSVERVLKKFAREADIEMPQLQKTPFVDGDEVLGFKLTPEFREAMRKTNLPSFKDGGLVSLGVL